MNPLVADISVATILTSGALAAIASALIAFLGTAKTLRANRPKTEAEADQYQSTANRQNIEAQAGVIGTLRSEVTRLEERAARQELRIEALETKLEASDQRGDQLEEQNTLLRREVETLQQRNQLLEQTLQQMQVKKS